MGHSGLDLLTLSFSHFDPMQKWARTLYLARKRFEAPLQLPTAASDIVLGWVCNGAVESSGAEFAPSGQVPARGCCGRAAGSKATGGDLGR
jgi:hypothetical protein